MKFKFPDYQKNIVNISASFAEFLGVPTEHSSLQVLKKALAKNPQNIVFICFDGMGINPMRINLEKDGFFFQNLKEQLTSVFPSTTTNATTTLVSAKTPSQHGWFAWSLYFDELQKVIDIYMNCDHYTKEKIDPNFVYGKMPYEGYYNTAKSGYRISTVFPSFVQRINAENNYYITTIEEHFDALNQIVKKEGKQFVYSYHPLPDSLMHQEGVTSEKTKELMRQIEREAEEFAKANPDTLIVISADHGQIDVSDYILIYKDNQFLSFLQTQPYGEARAMFVRVDESKRKDFVSYVRKQYRKDIKILSTKKLLQKGVFGESGKFDNLLGDFILVMKGHKQFVFCETDTLFKGHHTGLTQEMFVPLIIIND